VTDNELTKIQDQQKIQTNYHSVILSTHSVGMQTVQKVELNTAGLYLLAL